MTDKTPETESEKFLRWLETTREPEQNFDLADLEKGPSFQEFLAALWWLARLYWYNKVVVRVQKLWRKP
ncbi:hypothetical protein ACSSZE_10880 [Acidithiobacillus caldus]